MRRWLVAVILFGAVGCRSAQLRGAGPGHPSVVGHPSNRETAMPAGRNHPTNWGYGSAYDPHGTGSRGNPGLPGETGAFPPWWLAFPTPGEKPGIPPRVYDEPRPQPRR